MCFSDQKLVDLDLNGVWLIGDEVEFHFFQQRGNFLATAFFENIPIMGFQGKVSSVGGYATFDWVSEIVVSTNKFNENLMRRIRVLEQF